MVSLVELWLPILLSAAAVFVVSSVVHMVLPIHKGDCRRLAGEETVLAALRAQGVGPGEYMFPFCSSMAEVNSPAMVAKRKLGPVGVLTIRPGDVDIGRALLQWFVYTLWISFFVAYLASVTLPHDLPFASVFRFAGAAATLGYAFGSISNSIWKGVPWGTSVKFAFDGLLYGLATGAVFAWLWPDAA